MRLGRSCVRALLPPLLGIMLWGLGGCAPAHIMPEQAPPIPANGKNSVVAAARALTGVRYKYGGTSPSTGFDCSGLVWFTYHQIGVELPRASYEQFESGQSVGRRDIRAGDLVFFHLPGRTKSMHVGIATERGTFIHSPSSGGRVREDPLDMPYWRERYVGARRYVRQDG